MFLRDGWNFTSYTDSIIGGATGALLVTIILMIILVFVIIYVYTSLALMGIARKTKTKNAWLAWIPVGNFYLLTQMARKSGHLTWVLLFLLLPLPFVHLAATIVGIWLFWIVAERIKFPGWTSLLLLVPIANLIILGFWAWKKK